MKQLLQNAKFIAKCVSKPINTDQNYQVLPLNTNTGEHKRNTVAM